MDGIIMDNLSFIVIFSWYYYVLEPDDVISGNIDVEPKMWFHYVPDVMELIVLSIWSTIIF